MTDAIGLAVKVLNEADYLVFTDDYEVEQYVRYSREDIWMDVARDEGWIDPYDLDPAELAERFDLRVVDAHEASAYHDEHHSGAIRWCPHFPCKEN